MRLGPEIQALLRCALTGHLQRREDGIRPGGRRERGQFVVVGFRNRVEHRISWTNADGERSGVLKSRGCDTMTGTGGASLDRATNRRQAIGYAGSTRVGARR